MATEIQVQATKVGQVSVKRKGTLDKKTGRNLDSTPTKATADKNRSPWVRALIRPLKVLDDRGRVIMLLVLVARRESCFHDPERYR